MHRSDTTKLAVVWIIFHPKIKGFEILDFK